MTLAIISIIYLAALAVLTIAYSRLLKRARRALREAKEEAEDYHDSIASAGIGRAVFTDDREHERFNVWRGSVIVKYIPYGLNDPDDYAYKYIHAEEVAEMLNEEP